MVYVVDTVRYSFLGYADLVPAASLAVLVAITAAVLAVDVYLFGVGYDLTE